MTFRSRRLAALGALVIGSGALAASVMLLPRSIAYLHTHPDTAMAIRARLMGASYVGGSSVVHQKKMYDCGAACLKMILSARGIDPSLDELTAAANTTKRGASMLALRAAAERYGVRSKAWSLTAGDLLRAPLPVIAFVNGDHYVVVRAVVHGDTLEVDDPAMGKILWPVKAFQRRWRGETLVFNTLWSPSP